MTEHFRGAEDDVAALARHGTDALLGIGFYREAPERLLAGALQSLFALGARMPLTEVSWLLDRALAEIETAGPRAGFDDLRSDAAFWADCASPREAEVFFIACLRRLHRDRGRLNTAAQKRLLVALWEVLPEADRAAFLSKVDPEGSFRKT